MSLEDITSGSTIRDLDITNPAVGDDVSQGDDHIRNLKKAVTYTWPGISATVSGSAAEFAFAHKGGTVSGNAMIKGTFTASGSAVFNRDVHISATLSVGGTIKGASFNGYKTCGVYFGPAGTAIYNTCSLSTTHSSTGYFAITYGGTGAVSTVTHIGGSGTLNTVVRQVASGNQKYAVYDGAGNPADAVGIMVTIIIPE